MSSFARDGAASDLDRLPRAIALDPYFLEPDGDLERRAPNGEICCGLLALDGVGMSMLVLILVAEDGAGLFPKDFLELCELLMVFTDGDFGMGLAVVSSAKNDPE